MVVGDIARVTIQDVSWGVAEGVPDRRAAPILIPGTFDLVCSGRRAEQKGGWKLDRRSAVVVW
jgi:hypothetical protein